MNDQPLRVLVVDDTVTYRKIVSDILARIPGVQVVGVAANGKIALQKIEQLGPDLLTLDLEMPEVDGLALLRSLRQQGRSVGAIMLSAFTTQGAEATIQALELGAFDFVVKPNGQTMEENAATLEGQLRQKIEAFARSLPLARRLRPVAPIPAAKPLRLAGGSAGLARPGSDLPSRLDRIVRLPAGDPEVIALGISTGGPPALNKVLPQLPADLGAAVLIVQHMPPKFTLSLANDLAGRCRLAVSEASDGDVVRPGRIFIAPGGCQMKVVREAESNALIIRITDDPPENHCRPSVDYLFRSVAHVCGSRAVGVIMTGMGSDGTLGCRLMKRQGVPIIAQDEATCVVFGMPRILVEERLADVVAPLDQIAGHITALARRGVPVCR